ncbi:MAG TPA: glycogen synthase GlgA [Bryobacteraceae bacterium]|nr:glycogen synthase GlgA [Bryobacteraceae bacterium]
MTRVLMVASEVFPFSKTGGLGDVVGALPAALQALGDEVAVVTPRYRSIDLQGARRVWDNDAIYFGLDRYDISIYLAPTEFPLYLVDCPRLFDREGIYGEDGADYPDNHIRFGVLARAALTVARCLFRTDIFHCHDWQAGLVPVYTKVVFSTDPTFMGIKTLFTIHNLGYQGLFPKTALAEAGVDESTFTPDGLEFFGQVSYLKAGIMYADALNTVSPTYAQEIQTPEYGFGMDGVLRARAGVLSGILNGVDYRDWNPETDPLIPARYSASDLSGKRICKQHLLAEFGMPAAAMDAPLIGIVSRFTRQKGIDLIAQVAGEIVAEGMYLVAIGSGEPEYEDFLTSMAARYPDRIAVRVGFDSGVSHRIEAGADLFLMPSQYEPCGLNQMYSLKYGTIPVVRATGGLNDTIEDATGFKFREYSGRALMSAIRAAGRAFCDRSEWEARMRRSMEQDFSWGRPAAAYSALYRKLLGPR